MVWCVCVCVFLSVFACAPLAIWLARNRCLAFIFPHMSACAGLLVSGYWFSEPVSNSSDFQSGCNHFLGPRLSSVRPGASTLARGWRITTDSYLSLWPVIN